MRVRPVPREWRLARGMRNVSRYDPDQLSKQTMEF
jgi:hypothetical protein